MDGYDYSDNTMMIIWIVVTIILFIVIGFVIWYFLIRKDDKTGGNGGNGNSGGNSGSNGGRSIKSAADYSHSIINSNNNGTISGYGGDNSTISPIESALEDVARPLSPIQLDPKITTQPQPPKKPKRVIIKD